MTAHSAAEVLSRVHNPQIHVERRLESQISLLSPAEQVANIREVFAISMSDLAAILGVTRPTAYAWLSGQEPKHESAKRIQSLSSVADKFRQANIPRLDKLVSRPIVSGRSLLDILRTDENPLMALDALTALGNKEAQIRQESKSSGKHLRSLEDISDESPASTYKRS